METKLEGLAVLGDLTPGEAADKLRAWGEDDEADLLEEAELERLRRQASGSNYELIIDRKTLGAVAVAPEALPSSTKTAATPCNRMIP